jgi:hypothetical protein
MYYDREARTRSLEIAEKVLVFLLSNTSKLLAQLKGPVEIIEKVDSVDYKVKERIWKIVTKSRN